MTKLSELKPKKKEKVRDLLERAGVNVQGFPTTNGDFYVEAHHIIALCDSGCDTVDNVIALCPQHHRQAHYGKDAESLESEFIKILKRLNEK